MDEFRDCEDIHYRSKYKHERTIIHIDLDCFYAQVEMLKNPELTSKPVGIKQQHYVITSNYVAREFGIRKCMLITEALALCPKLVIVNGEDLHDYRVMSSKVTEVIRQFSAKVEKLGLDENFVDVTDVVASKLNSGCCRKDTVVGHIYKNEIEYFCTCGCKDRLILGSHIASEIRAKLKEELGITSCAGIGHNKLLAKLVCPTHKPNQQTTVFPCAATSLVLNLKWVRAIPGIGRKTSDILNALGINSVNDAQNVSLDLLEKHLGKVHASWIKAACFGVDDNDVKESGKQQVIGLEEASKGINSMQDVQSRLTSLVERGLLLLQEDGRFPTTIRVAVRKYSQGDYTRQRESKQCAINPSIFRTSLAKEQVLETAVSLFKKLVDHTKPFHLTLLGLAFTKFQEEIPAKSSLFNFLEKMSKINKSSSVAESRGNKIVFEIKDGEICDSSGFAMKTTAFGDVDESVLKELPEDIQSEILQSFSQQTDKPGSSTAQPNDLQCPVGVDSQVFKELPYEIQIELVRDSSNTSTKILKNSAPGHKKQNSILNYLKK